MPLSAVTSWFSCFGVSNEQDKKKHEQHEQDKKKHEQHEQDKKKHEQVTQADNTMGWYIDSGATVHLCKDKTQFKAIEAEESDEHVRMANNARSKVCGKGSVELNLTSGKTLTLTNVYYVPDLSINLVSVDVLDKEGFEVSAKGGNIILSKGGVLVGEAYSFNQLYKLSVKK